MNIKKILIAGILAGIVIEIIALIIGTIVQAIWPFNIFEFGGMRAMNDPIMLLFFLQPWVISFAMAIVYSYVGKATDGNVIWKGKKFGLLVWLVSSVPSVFVVYVSMNYPIGFTINQVVGSFFYMIGAGITVARVME